MLHFKIQISQKLNVLHMPSRRMNIHLLYIRLTKHLQVPIINMLTKNSNSQSRVDAILSSLGEEFHVSL
jgi:hypothetical protein